MSVKEEDIKKIENNVITNTNANKPLIALEYYKNSKKHKKQLGSRTWRTRKDPFEIVSKTLLIQLSINPGINAKDLLKNFQKILICITLKHYKEELLIGGTIIYNKKEIIN